MSFTLGSDLRSAALKQNLIESDCPCEYGDTDEDATLVVVDEPAIDVVVVVVVVGAEDVVVVAAGGKPTAGALRMNGSSILYSSPG